MSVSVVLGEGVFVGSGVPWLEVGVALGTGDCDRLGTGDGVVLGVADPAGVGDADGVGEDSKQSGSSGALSNW